MKKIFTIIITSIMTLSTSQAESFKIQNIRVGGLGCPSETTQINISTDNQTASLLFNSFETRVPVVVTGPKDPGNISILNCTIFVDIKLPANIKLDSVSFMADLRGYTSMQKGVTGSFKSFLVSKNGLGTEVSNRSNSPESIYVKEWGGKDKEVDEDLNIRVSKKIQTQSKCSRGGSADVVTVRLQNILTTQILAGSNPQSEGSITMDSSDISGGFKISAQSSLCRPGPKNEDKNCRMERVGNKMVEICR